MNSNIDEEVKKLPTEKELAALSEKERKSFFRSLIKKLNGAEKTSEKPADKPEEIPTCRAEENEGGDETVLSELKADKRFKELDKLLPRMEKLPYCNACRLGNIMYSIESEDHDLENTFRLTSGVLSVFSLKKGQSVAYSHAYTAKVDGEKIADIDTLGDMLRRKHI